jgi:hypothetical protein
MIILTQEQADTVRGPTGPLAALDPVPLANGTEWVLPESVLTAPEHQMHHALLDTLPKREIAPNEWHGGQ